MCSTLPNQLFIMTGIGLITIRLLTESDLPALEWDGQYTHFRYLYAKAFRSAQAGYSRLWVAEYIDQTIIGQLFVQLSSLRSELADGQERAYIYGFRIKPTHRGQNIRSRMLQVAEADLVEHHFKWITLNVSKTNINALGFYQHHGYQIIAEENNKWSYIDHQGRMRKVIDPSWRMEKLVYSASDVNIKLDLIE